MNKIDTTEWKKFKIGGEDGLFQVTRGQRFVVGKHEKGDIPYYSASLDNNGITDYISNPIFTDENAIVVTTFGNSFYAKDKFTASDEVTILHHDKLNETNALFIATAICKNSYKYSFKVKAFMTRIIEDFILLPSKNNEPDWEYMEEYMKSIVDNSEQKIENLNKNKTNKKKIDVSAWREFKINDLFYKCKLKKKDGFKKTNDTSLFCNNEFNLPLVNAKHGNNGIMYYGREKDFESESMTIDIVQNGAIAVGDVYAQPQGTSILEDAYLIKPYDDIKSEAVLFYLATVIQKEIKQHFSYDNKCTWDKAKKLYIHLPINNINKPDFKYMENYMKNITKTTKSKLECLTC